jgi:glycosyltransferase involved in cell wall biosynthesis
MSDCRGMDVTAVVACHDYGSYLEEAIGSLLGQEGGAPGVVVVDDGSTDPHTREVLGRLPPEVQVIHQANRGVAVARNTGIAASETPLVLVLDADDRLAPGALAALRAGLAAAPGASFAYGHQRFLGELGGVMRFPQYDPLRLLDRHLIGPTALMRRELLRDTGGYDPAFALFEDWELWVAALAHGHRGVLVDAVTHEYRRHSGSKLSRDRRRYREFRRQMRAKHKLLFADRRRLAAESDLSLLGRAAYRFYWGPRPLPAAVEELGQRLVFRAL